MTADDALMEARRQVCNNEFERMTEAAKQCAVEEAVEGGEIGYCDDCDRGCCDGCDVYSEGKWDGYEDGYRDAVIGERHEGSDEEFLDARLRILTDKREAMKRAAEREAKRKLEQQIH